jgi:hypothetical protein
MRKARLTGSTAWSSTTISGPVVEGCVGSSTAAWMGSATGSVMSSSIGAEPVGAGAVSSLVVPAAGSSTRSARPWFEMEYEGVHGERGRSSSCSAGVMGTLRDEVDNERCNGDQYTHATKESK